MHTPPRAVNLGRVEAFRRDSPWVVADLGIYGTRFNPYDVGNPLGGYPNEVGFGFIKKLAKKVAKVARPVVGVARKTFVPVMVTERALGAARSLAAGGPRAILPMAMQALPQVQQALKMSGPLGMVASGAAGALAAAVQGKSLEQVAWAAAEGASPPGIDRAVAAARALREGQPVLNIALSQARQSFAPGSPAQRAFDLGVSAVKGGAKGVLNSTRGQLRSAAEQAAFDAAVGTISKAAHGLPAHPMTRPDPLALASRARPALAGYRHPNTELALAALRRAPALRRLSLGDLSRRLNLPARAVADARGLLDTGAPGDELGAYTLRAGDTGSGLAKRFTGDANRWRELPAVNKRGLGRYSGSKDMVVKQVKDKTGKITTTLLDPFYSGLVINVPPGWAGPGITAGAPAPTTPIPVPPVVTAPPEPTSPIPGIPVSVPPVIAPPVTPTPTTPPATVPSPIPGGPPITVPPGLPTTPPVIPPGVPGATPPVEPPTLPIPVPPGVPGAAPPVAKKKDDGAGIALGLAAAGLLLM